MPACAGRWRPGRTTCGRRSCPTKEDWAALSCRARYLLLRPRVACCVPWRKGGQCLTVCADTDFAGCVAARSSTCGGAAVWGARAIKH
eukprot:5444126-Alexandrium_andersonii.AAC.1